MEPTGTNTIAFASVGRPNYGFDVFYVHLHSTFSSPSTASRTASPSISTPNLLMMTKPWFISPNEPVRPGSSFSTGNPVPRSPHHQQPQPPPLLHFGSSAPGEALQELVRALLHQAAVPVPERGAVNTPWPPGLSPAISESGTLIAVASYGARPWPGEFHHLQTDILVFEESDPAKRVLVCRNGGWPTFSGDSTLYFHRKADDGWSPADDNVIFTSIGPIFESVGASVQVARVTFDPSHLSESDDHHPHSIPIPVDIKILTKEETGNNAFPFTANLGGVTAEPVALPNQFQPYGELYMVRVDGSGLQRLTWNGYENGTPAWHPNTDFYQTNTNADAKGEDRLKGRFDDPLWIRTHF